MKRKSLLKRSLAVLLAAAMAVMGGHVEALLLRRPQSLQRKARLPRENLLLLKLQIQLKRLQLILTCTVTKSPST